VAASAKKIYAATPYSVFSVDKESGETERLSKVWGLSETGIQSIAFDSLSNKLIIAYTNSNIDILEEKGIRNIPGIKRENIAGDKSIYSIFPDNDRCYLATGLGVIVLDMRKYEVQSSWFLGASGSYVKVFAVTRSDAALYAATQEGLKKIALNHPGPNDFRNWQQLSGSNGLSSVPARSVVRLGNKIIVQQSDSLFVETSGGWSFFFANGKPIANLHASGGRLMISQRSGAGPSQVLALNESGTIIQTLAAPGVISFPEKGITSGSEYWVADRFGGLSRWRGTSFTSYKINSPEGIATGTIAVHNNVVYAAAGSVNDSWNYLYNPNGIYRYQNNEWKSFNLFSTAALDTLLDFVTIAPDPRDGSVWGGSFGGGLVHLKDDKVERIYKQASPLKAPPGDPGSFRVAGLAFDKEANLWVANFGAQQQLHVLKADGTWKSFTVPFFLFENAVSQIIIDDAGRKWIVSPLGNGVILFDDRGTIDNTADDRWRLFRSGAGAGSLPSSEVHSIARDKNDFIWIGTSDGTAVIQCGEEALGRCEAVLPVIIEGGFNAYLFKGVAVRSIAVDGADRKWVATSNGVWLVSPSGEKVLEHFTEDNSPLPSNNVHSIGINGTTGEVFFGTSNGIASFRGTATEAGADKNNVLVFPNPVPPGYSGTIAIKGLPDASFVKITELNGRLVYQSRSLGGQAVWNGRDYRGNPAASGIYLVLVVDKNKQEKAVTRIVFIAK
jgi:hypothetical protein